MPFLFIYVCDLLEKLEEPHKGDLPLLPAKLREYTNTETIKWFQLHNNKLSDFGVNSDALVLMLRPESFTDRDYGLDNETLELVIARILQLSRQDYVKLQRWRREPHLCDLGICVGEVLESLKSAPVPSQGHKVTVEEIDSCLLRIASHHPNSSLAVRSFAGNWRYIDAIDMLGGLFSRLRAREAKWLTRYILKTYGPVKVPEKLRPDSSHSGLPNFLDVSIDMLSSLAPVTTYRDGTMIIKGLSSTASSRPEHSLPRQSYSKMAGREVSSNDLHQDAFAASSTGGPPRNSVEVSDLRISQASQASSQPYEPIIFQRGLLKPRKDVENRASSIDSATMTHGKSKSATETADHCRLSNSPVRPVGPKTILTPASSLEKSSPTRSVLGRISENASLGSFGSRSTSRIHSQTSSSPFRPSNPLLRAGSGRCLMTSTACPLTRCIFLLSPCINESPRIINNLLPWHGARYLTSLSALASPHLPSHCLTTGKNYRKIVLVDMYNRKATVDFLCKIEELQLQRRVKRGKRDGKGRKWDKEWVEVYDWRLLECIAKMDQGKVLGYNAWKRCFLCVI